MRGRKKCGLELRRWPEDPGAQPGLVEPSETLPVGFLHLFEGACGLDPDERRHHAADPADASKPVWRRSPSPSKRWYNAGVSWSTSRAARPAAIAGGLPESVPAW